jgi:signal transduction histidine kinase
MGEKDSMSERSLKIIVLFLSITAHVITFLQFKVHSVSEIMPANWINSFTGLLIISLLITFVLPFFENRSVKKYLFMARGMIGLLAGQISGDYFGVELTLLAIVIIEAGVYTSYQFGLTFGVVLNLGGFMLQTPTTFFGMVPPYYISWHERLGFIILLLLITGVTVLLRFHRENQIPATELNRRLQEATWEMAQTNMKLQEYAITAEQEAMLNERKRMAREIHDTLAYTLTNILMMMEAAIDMANKSSPDLVKHLEVARNQAKEGLSEVRYALQALRPVEFSGFVGLSAIQRLVRAFEKAAQIKVELELGDVPLYLGEEANLTLFRLVQEGLTNALRHGKATRIMVLFTRDGDGVYVSIKDNGIGSGNTGPKTGFGLLGMQERVERLGGRLEVISEPGVGFTLRAWIPLREG